MRPDATVRVPAQIQALPDGWARPPTLQDLLKVGQPWQRLIGRWLAPRDPAKTIRRLRWASSPPAPVAKLADAIPMPGFRPLKPDGLTALELDTRNLFRPSVAGLELALLAEAAVLLGTAGSQFIQDPSPWHATVGIIYGLFGAAVGAAVAGMRFERAEAAESINRQMAEGRTFSSDFRSRLGVDRSAVERYFGREGMPVEFSDGPRPAEVPRSRRWSMTHRRRLRSTT